MTTTSWNAGTNLLVLEDLTLQATGGDLPEFRYIYVYDDTTANDDIIGYFDFGKGISLSEYEELLIDFDQSQGLFGNNHSLIPNETLPQPLQPHPTIYPADQLVVFWTVDLLFDSPNAVYMWSGLGDLDLNGKPTLVLVISCKFQS
jgi:hypothetical protein